VDTLRIARDLSEGDVFSHEQAERLANALATYYAELRDNLVTKEYLDARLDQLEARLDAKLETQLNRLDSKFESQLAHLEAKFETQLARVQNRILASLVALFVLLGVAILLKP
jgi:hypothetical protein